MLKIDFFFCFWKGQSAWAEDKLAPTVNQSRSFKSSEASLSYTWLFFFSFIPGMIPTHCDLCLSASIFLECSNQELTNVTFKSCLCPWTVALLTERAVTAHSPEWHILTLALVQVACLAAQKMDEKQNKVLSLGKCCACVELWPKCQFFAYPWGCGTMRLTDMCHLWWHEPRRNVLFWLQACRISCNPFPNLPFDWLIRTLLPQSPFLLSAQSWRVEVSADGCSSWWCLWGVTGLDPGNAQALGTQLQIHIFGILLKWSCWNSCKKANYINEEHWTEFNPQLHHCVLCGCKILIFLLYFKGLREHGSESCPLCISGSGEGVCSAKGILLADSWEWWQTLPWQQCHGGLQRHRHWGKEQQTTLSSLIWGLRGDTETQLSALEYFNLELWYKYWSWSIFLSDLNISAEYFMSSVLMCWLLWAIGD